MKEFIKKWVLPPGVADAIGRAIYAPQAPKAPGEVAALLKKNEELRDRHAGQRCFILGAGSSIKKQDLKKLKGEIIISVSNTFVHPDYSTFRPMYHVLPPLLASHSQYDPANHVQWLREMEAKTFEAEMFFHIGDWGFMEENGLFRGRQIHWVEYRQWDGGPVTALDLSRVPVIWSVSELAITVALFMGFEKIYLLGIDHDWFKGIFVYFYDEKTEHALKPTKDKVSFADSEFQMRRHAEIFKKYKYLYGLKKNIYNANADPETYLDVFPKVNYDVLFQ